METGKIFADSTGVIQDQAKILFNYYRQAAEKIVTEEERIESQIRDLEEQRAEREQQISKLWVWFLTIVLFFVYFIKKNNLEKEIADINTRIDEFRRMHKEIFRDYAVTKLGVAYVPVADQIKYEDRSFIVDYTGAVPESEVTLSMSRRNDLLIDTIGHLENLATEAPLVESSENAEIIDTDEYSISIQQVSQNDYLGDLERSLRTISFCMDDLETASVQLPLVLDNSQQLSTLHEYATSNPPAKAPVVTVFDSERFTAGIDRFRQINDLKNSLSSETAQFEDVLRNLMSTIAGSVQSIAQIKLASVDKVVTDSNRILFQILKAPYNHYSPVLEYEEIERIRHEKFDFSNDIQGYEPFSLRASSRVKYNPVTGMWVAEDGSTTTMPFGMHQLYEEIVAPVVQNLMMETRIERLKIYNNIKDQKLSYLNKWHQDTEAFYRANRAESSDIINLMQESLREYVAAYNTLVSLKRTEESMASSGSLDNAVVEATDNATQTLAAFELQSQEFQRVQSDFEEYMDRLKDDIDLKAERFGHVEYYDARLRDGYSNEMATASSEIQEMDVRRKDLAEVNPLLAKTSQLPPQPQVEEITFEHIAINLPAMTRTALEELDSRAEDVEVPETNEPLNEPYDMPVAATSSFYEEETIDDNEEFVDDEENVIADEHELDDVEEEYVDADEEIDDNELDDVDEEYVDEEEDNDEEEEEEDIEISQELLDSMTDLQIANLMEEVGLDVPMPFNRSKAIATLLEAAEDVE